MTASSKIIINKFGGEIMGSDVLINIAVSIIDKQIKQGLKPINVVSACFGVTDELEIIIKEALSCNKYKDKVANDLIYLIQKKHYKLVKKLLGENCTNIEKEINKEIDETKKDYQTLNRFGSIDVVLSSMMSHGERLSSLIFSTVLKNKGIKNSRYTSGNTGIITDDNYLSANIDYNKSKKQVKKNIKLKDTPVVCGYCGKNTKGKTTVLGRGGSDVSACLLGSVFDVKKINLWKTTDGVLTADPRRIKNSKTVKQLSYVEAAESGKVICDRAIQYAQKNNTTVIVSNINDKNRYTTVSKNSSNTKEVKIITCYNHKSILEIYSSNMNDCGIFSEIIYIIAKNKINIDIIRNTRDKIYIVVEKNEKKLKKAIQSLEKINYKVKNRDCAMINVIGNLNWEIVNQFNIVLKQISKTPDFGAFPYQECVRLEAVVPLSAIDKTVNKLHNLFVK